LNICYYTRDPHWNAIRTISKLVLHDSSSVVSLLVAVLYFLGGGEESEAACEGSAHGKKTATGKRQPTGERTRNASARPHLPRVSLRTLPLFHGSVSLSPPLSLSLCPVFPQPRRRAMRVNGLSIVLFQGRWIRQVSCYTFISGFRLPWPPPCCSDPSTPFMGSSQPSSLGHVTHAFGESRVARPAYQERPM